MKRDICVFSFAVRLSYCCQEKSLWVYVFAHDDAKTMAAALSRKRGSNPRPAAWEAAALPTELFLQINSLQRAVLLHKLCIPFPQASTPASYRHVNEDNDVEPTTRSHRVLCTF